MSLKKIPDAALKELQAAVGEEHVSADPGMLEVYSYMNSFMSAFTGVWWISPVAIIQPANRDEIQKAMQICKKHNLHVKPQATTWMFTSMACSADTVIFDLRRMNDITEINETDGYVVIDPVTTSGTQQVELMKHGLNSHTNGAGPNACILPSATSVQGSGGTSQSMSNSERNCLGVELLTTDGEILHFGSPGTPNAGWFCGDGPGPSLRGMMRGAVGNLGGQGIYTKIGAKCYPWYAKPFDVNGSPPFFKATEPENYILRNCMWYNWDDECDGLYRISEAEICDYFARLGPGAYEEALSCTNEEYISMQESKVYERMIPNGAWTASIAASCPEEMEARLRVLEHIVADTGGLCIDPHDMGADAFEVVIQTTIRGCYIFKAAHMPTGGWGCFTPMTYETIDNIWKINQPVNEQIKKSLIDPGYLENDGYDNTYASLDEHGHFGHCESPFHVEFWEPKEQSLTGMIDGVIQGFKHKIPILYSPMSSDPVDLMTYVKYLGKIQSLIDPSRTMDSLTGGMFGMIRELDDIDELETLGEEVMKKVAT